MTVTTVLLDLDGVIRHFDPGHLASVEQHHGLAEGSLMTAGFEPGRLHLLITGRMTRAEWTTEIGEAVGNPAAAAEWLDAKGAIDEELMAVVGELRAAGVTVAVLTNGTDTIPEELVELSVVDRVDAVFNSAEIGYAKPDRRAFEHVVGALEIDPAEVFFSDDSASKLSGAIELGMTARLYEGVAVFRGHLQEFGIGAR